jgi:hypothetical protein
MVSPYRSTGRKQQRVVPPHSVEVVRCLAGSILILNTDIEFVSG